jgi:hypothetical protein
MKFLVIIFGLAALNVSEGRLICGPLNKQETSNLLPHILFVFSILKI